MFVSLLVIISLRLARLAFWGVEKLYYPSNFVVKCAFFYIWNKLIH